MPTSCSAYGCTNCRLKGNGLQFFTFPLKDEVRLKKWLVAVGRKNFVPTKFSTLCSKHFTPDDYELRPGIIVPYLKKTSVPTIFNHHGTVTSLRKMSEYTEKVSTIGNTTSDLFTEEVTIKEEQDPLDISDGYPPQEQNIAEAEELRSPEHTQIENDSGNKKSLEVTLADVYKNGGLLPIIQQASSVEVVFVKRELEPSETSRAQPEKYSYRKKIKSLCQKVRRQERRILNLKKKLRDKKCLRCEKLKIRVKPN